MNTTAPGALAPLAFHGTPLEIVDRNNRLWLRLPQIEGALGYANKGTALQTIYSRHADEFTPAMTDLVKLPTPGGEQMVRIFSLRGAHLLAMFSRTPVAAEFRRWVLDLLDQEAAKPQTTDFPPEIQPVLPGEIDNRQFAILERLLRERAPSNPGLRAFTVTMGRHFGIDRLKQLPADRFLEACEYLLAQPLPRPRIPVPRPRKEPVTRNALVSLAGETPPPDSRWLLGFDVHGQPHIRRVASGTLNLDMAELPSIIAEPGGPVPRALLPRIIAAAAKRL